MKYIGFKHQRENKQNSDNINILPLIEGVMVDYHTQKTNIIRDEVEGDIVVF